MCVLTLERMMGVEPTLSAWEAGVLPINYIRIACIIAWPFEKCNTNSSHSAP